MRISADHKQLYDKNVLTPCEDCAIDNLQKFNNSAWHLPFRQCDKCLNWDALMDSELALTSLPKHYPVKSLTNENRDTIPAGRLVVKPCGTTMLKPFEVTYESMKQALDLAHVGILEHRWDGRTTHRAFLIVEGLNDAIITKAWTHTSNAKALQFASGDAHATLQRDAVAHPSLYQPMPYPAPWLKPGIELTMHVEAIMHELLLGAVNSVMSLIQNALKRRSSNQPFIAMMKPYMEHLVQNTVDWLKARDYKGGGYAGYISESYLGFARLAPWFYQNLLDTKPDKSYDADKPPEDKPQQQWKKDCQVYWLRVRGLDTEGLLAEVKERVAKYMNVATVPFDGLTEIPEELPVPELDSADVENLITAMTNLLQCVFSATVSSNLVSKLQYAVRIFLSAYDRLDTKLRKKTRTPSVITCYNFMCMMNLPKDMSTFGPQRHLFEGKVQGEGYLPKVKAQFNHGSMKTSWEFNMLIGLLRSMSFKHVLGTPERKGSPLKHMDALKDRKAKFRKYKSKLEVKSIMNECTRKNKRTLCVIMLVDLMKEPRIFAVTGADAAYDSLVEIKWEHEPLAQNTVSKCGLVYHKFNLADKEANELSWENDIAPKLDTPSLGYAYLFPLLDVAEPDQETTRLFSLVSSNWKSLTLTNTVVDLVETSPYNTTSLI